MRTVLADRQPAVRRALRVLLTQDLGLEVVGEVEAADGLQASVRALQPDLLIVDWDLLAADAGATLVALRRSRGGVHIVVLGIRPEDRSAALAAGADAFVSKVDGPDQVVSALCASHQTLPVVESPPEKSLMQDTIGSEGEDHVVA